MKRNRFSGRKPRKTIRRYILLPKPFHFASVWLALGAVALFLRAYLENVAKKRLVLDRVASERDMEAFHMQQEISPRMQEETDYELTFSEAKLPKS